MTTRRVYYFATPPFYHSTSLLILPPHRLTTRPVYYLAAPLFDHFTGLPICQPYRLTNCFRKSLRRGWQALTATARQPTFPKLPATSLAHDRPAWPPPACAPQDRPTQAARPPEPPATPSHLAPPVGSRSPRGGGGVPRPGGLAAPNGLPEPPRQLAPRFLARPDRTAWSKSPWYGWGDADVFGCAAQTQKSFPIQKVSGWRAFAAREPLRGKFALSTGGRVVKRGSKKAQVR